MTQDEHRVFIRNGLLAILCSAVLSSLAACATTAEDAQQAFDAGKPGKAAKILKEMPPPRPPEAAWKLGVMYFDGKGLEADLDKGTFYLKEGKKYFLKNKDNFSDNISGRSVDDYETILNKLSQNGRVPYLEAISYSMTFSTSYDEACRGRTNYNAPCATLALKWQLNNRYLDGIMKEPDNIVKGIVATQGKIAGAPIKWFKKFIPEGRVDLLRWYLENGADPNEYLTVSNKTPLHAIAGYYGPEETARKMYRVLLEHGADPNEIDSHTTTYPQSRPLVDAAARFGPETLNLLVEIEDYRRNQTLDRALINAAKHNNVEAVDYLLEQGADPTNRHGRERLTAWDLAAKKGHDDTMNRLAEVTPVGERKLDPPPEESDIVSRAMTTQMVELRSRPDYDAAGGMSLTPNSPVLILSVEGQWCKVTGRGLHYIENRFWWDGKLDGQYWAPCKVLEKADF